MEGVADGPYERCPLAIAPTVDFYVELATSTLTWTKRKVTFAVDPACGWHDLDVTALVLSESVDGVHPLRVMTSPPPGENNPGAAPAPAAQSFAGAQPIVSSNSFDSRFTATK